MTAEHVSDPTLAPPELDRLADLTSRYARYSRSAGGLSSVAGGVLCAMAFLIGALVPLDEGLRYVLAGAPIAWIATKEALRHFYYQGSGAALERISERQRRVRFWMTVYLAAISSVVIGGLLFAGYRDGRLAELLQWPWLGYLAVVVALPFIARRWFWSSSDFLVGVLLFCQSAVVLAGGTYPPAWILIAASFALVAIATGWREHREYLRLRHELGLGLDGAAA